MSKIVFLLVVIFVVASRARHIEPGDPAGDIDDAPRDLPALQRGELDSDKSVIRKVQDMPARDPFVARQAENPLPQSLIEREPKLEIARQQYNDNMLPERQVELQKKPGAPERAVQQADISMQKYQPEPKEYAPQQEAVYAKKRVNLRESASQFENFVPQNNQEPKAENLNMAGPNNNLRSENFFHEDASQMSKDVRLPVESRPNNDNHHLRESAQNLMKSANKAESKADVLKSFKVEYAKVVVKAEEADDNGPVEVVCTVGYKDVAEIHWSVNGKQLEPFVAQQQSTVMKDELPVKVSKLTVAQLERIPTETGKYLFECSALVDGQYTKATVAVGSNIEDSCKKNDDCESRGALCSQGTCTCKANQPVSLKSKHLTCRPASHLGWPCHYSEQCSFVVSNSICSNTMHCECTSGFQKTSDGKMCTKGTGTYCASNADCDFLKGTCENNLCACTNETSLKMGLCVKPIKSSEVKQNIQLQAGASSSSSSSSAGSQKKPAEGDKGASGSLVPGSLWKQTGMAALAAAVFVNMFY